jgi:hypothetical protein
MEVMMSSMERNKGKLIPTTWDEIVKEFPEAEAYDLCWTTNDKYQQINGQFYKVCYSIKRDTENCFEFSEVTVNQDGSVCFHTYHYNGGADWTELVEDKLKENK